MAGTRVRGTESVVIRFGERRSGNPQRSVPVVRTSDIVLYVVGRGLDGVEFSHVRTRLPKGLVTNGRRYGVSRGPDYRFEDCRIGLFSTGLRKVFRNYRDGVFKPLLDGFEFLFGNRRKRLRYHFHLRKDG